MLLRPAKKNFARYVARYENGERNGWESIMASMVRVQRYCKGCRQYRLFDKQRVNHLLHFFISLLSAGVWAIVWALLVIANMFRRYRCPHCGQGRYL